MVGAPTTSTTENGATDITTKTVYDEQGRVVKEIGADSNGADAGTTLTYYYDAGAPTGVPSTCVNTAKWAGLACQTRTAESTPTVPVTTTTEYSYYLAAGKTTEVLDAVTRTSTTVFDSAGRLDTITTSVAGLSGSTAQPTSKNVYSATTGLQTETQTLSGSTVSASVKTGYDSWGRATSYTDEGGKVSTTTYDSAGRISKETSSTGVVTTNTYDAYSGSVTKKNVSGVGDFTASYDLGGNIVSQSLPTGLTQTSTYDRTGQEIGLSYTITGSQGQAAYGWTMDHDALGRISRIAGPSASGGSRVSEYSFDQAARMISASDQIDDQCTTRTYGFDTVGRRTSLKTSTSTCGDTSSVVNATKTWTFDKADRILTGANATGEYIYDKLGRQTSLPGIDTPQGTSAGNITVSYYDSDLARSVSQNGVTTTYNLDVMDRRSTSTTAGGTSSSTTTRYYEDTSDNPAWATTTTGSVVEKSRYLSSIAGDLSATLNVDTKFLSAGIVDPQGSVVATTYRYTPPVDSETGEASETVTAWSGLESFDEYGNKLTSSETKSTGALNYSWLGGKERSTDLTGLVLMGVRLYNSTTGQFTSVDPVKGGNSTAYAYPQDPINKYDLDGKWGWAKKLGKWAWKNKWDIVAAAASFIPGVGLGVAAVRTFRFAKAVKTVLSAAKTGTKGVSATYREVQVAGKIWTRGKRVTEPDFYKKQPYDRMFSNKTQRQYRSPTVKTATGVTKSGKPTGYDGTYANFQQLGQRESVHIRIRGGAHR